MAATRQLLRGKTFKTYPGRIATTRAPVRPPVNGSRLKIWYPTGTTPRNCASRR